MGDITFSDISEHQPSIDAGAYIAGGHTVLIVRAHNGYRADNTMPQRASYLRGFNFDALGFYQYVAADRDAGQQAQEFCATVGKLKANEFAVADFEEGQGNQTSRANAWFKVVDPFAGCMAALYSGQSFLNTSLSGPAYWGKRPLWIAAYPSSYTPNPSSEPPGCDWWQYSDRGSFPGLDGGVDANVYHGTPDQFRALVRPGAAPPPAKPPVALYGTTVIQNRDGRLEEFVETGSGEVLHRWQSKPNGPWSERWASLGTP
jgi:lysozyme